MAVDTLLGSLVAKWNATAALGVGVTGKFWTGEVPETQELPFAALGLLSEEPNWTFESHYTETSRVQLAVWTKGAEACDRFIYEIKKAFDWCTDLTFANAAEIKVMRTNATIVPEEWRAPDSSIVYRGTVDYEIEVRRTLGT